MERTEALTAAGGSRTGEGAGNKKPVYYCQSDPRWRDKPYRVKKETSTIGSAGCGPTCAAMAIATLKDGSVTPVTTCAWSMANGYKALGQGTYYSYFQPQMAAFGIECRQLLGGRILDQPEHPVHEQVRERLGQGYYAIALMGPGIWTKRGHFVLVWAWNDKVRILDPASQEERRTNGDPAAFRRQVRCYWLIDARGPQRP
ncbi:C39 family peptidase [uncultured Oscillibacter sp.]|uniref:C39 family peptidase n=1 Tax=uncultured Oscillibacter sp. TaxID=876091 RepID=UPI0025F0B312|nr:C39 family peptidase [uncultured Oscillibacter sp.]